MAKKTLARSAASAKAGGQSFRLEWLQTKTFGLVQAPVSCAQLMEICKKFCKNM